jgi:hypothetical protein
MWIWIHSFIHSRLVQFKSVPLHRASQNRFCIFLGVLGQHGPAFICLSNGSQGVVISKHGFLGMVIVAETSWTITTNFWAFIYTFRMLPPKNFPAHLFNLQTVLCYWLSSFISAWTIRFFSCLIVIEFWHYEVSLHSRSYSSINFTVQLCWCPILSCWSMADGPSLLLVDHYTITWWRMLMWYSLDIFCLLSANILIGGDDSQSLITLSFGANWNCRLYRL